RLRNVARRLAVAHGIAGQLTEHRHRADQDGQRQQYLQQREAARPASRARPCAAMDDHNMFAEADHRAGSPAWMSPTIETPVMPRSSTAMVCCRVSINIPWHEVAVPSAKNSTAWSSALAGFSGMGPVDSLPASLVTSGCSADTVTPSGKSFSI